MRVVSRALGRSRRRATLQSHATLGSLGKEVSGNNLLSISSLIASCASAEATLSRRSRKITKPRSWRSFSTRRDHRMLRRSWWTFNLKPSKISSLTSSASSSGLKHGKGIERYHDIWRRTRLERHVYMYVAQFIDDHAPSFERRSIYRNGCPPHLITERR